MIWIWLFAVSIVSFVGFVFGWAVWETIIYNSNIDKLESKGCFEKDGVQLTLNDFNRTDVHIIKYGGEFWICPT